MFSPFVAQNIYCNARISLMSHLGGDAKCKNYRKFLYNCPTLVPQTIHAFAKAFDDFTKQFIYTRFSHCPERLLSDTMSYSIVKQLNSVQLTKGDPLCTLACFANIINNPDFIVAYMRDDENVDAEDIALNYVFLEEFITKFYNFGENWLWNYFRKYVYFTLQILFRIFIYLCIAAGTIVTILVAPIAYVIFILIVTFDRLSS